MWMMNMNKYEKAKKYIDESCTNPSLINALDKFLNIINKLYKYNISLKKYNIVIDNIEKEDQDIILKSVLKILSIYGIDLHEFKHSNKDKNMDFYRCINDSMTFFFEYIERIEEARNDLLIIMYKNNLDDVNDLFTNSVYDKNKYIRITLEDKNKKESIDELKKLYKKNKIKSELSIKDYNDLYDLYIEQKKCNSNSFVNTIYNESIKYLIDNNKDYIDKAFINYSVSNDDSISINKTNLNDLVGLKRIKKEIEFLKKYVNYCRKNNIDIKNKYLNMFFMGAPGTGKTTVARALTDVFYDLGLIKENKLVEVTPSEMQGLYVGHTQNKVKDIFKNAENGILFIDEAYNFSRAEFRGGLFLKEALELLLKYMEDPSHIVILSGYETDMMKLYKLNSGFKSRIYKEIKFDNYSNQELYRILTGKLKEYNLTISSKKVKDKVYDLFSNVKNDEEFGNARYCESLAQLIMINHINNDEASQEISEEDIPSYEINSAEKVMGFTYG